MTLKQMTAIQRLLIAINSQPDYSFSKPLAKDGDIVMLLIRKYSAQRESWMSLEYYVSENLVEDEMMHPWLLEKIDEQFIQFEQQYAPAP